MMTSRWTWACVIGSTLVISASSRRCFAETPPAGNLQERDRISLDAWCGVSAAPSAARLIRSSNAKPHQRPLRVRTDKNSYRVGDVLRLEIAAGIGEFINVFWVGAGDGVFIPVRAESLNRSPKSFFVVISEPPAAETFLVTSSQQAIGPSCHGDDAALTRSIKSLLLDSETAVRKVVVRSKRG